MVRLVEYVDPKDRDNAYDVQVARGIFLRRIELVAPGVLKDLRAIVLPCFIAARDAGCADGILKAVLEDPTVVQKLKEQKRDQWPQLSAFAVSYMAWVDRHHLPESWLYPVVLTTLDTWHRLPDLTTRFHILNVSFWVEAPLEPPPLPYRPTQEAEVAFKARNAAWVRRSVQAARRLAKRRNMELAPNTLRQGDEPALYFDWLVRYKILLVSCVTIGLEESLDPSVVYKAISSLAKLIGVRRRRK